MHDKKIYDTHFYSYSIFGVLIMIHCSKINLHFASLIIEENADLNDLTGLKTLNIVRPNTLKFIRRLKELLITLLGIMMKVFDKDFTVSNRSCYTQKSIEISC